MCCRPAGNWNDYRAAREENGLPFFPEPEVGE